MQEKSHQNGESRRQDCCPNAMTTASARGLNSEKGAHRGSFRNSKDTSSKACCRSYTNATISTAGRREHSAGKDSPRRAIKHEEAPLFDQTQRSKRRTKACGSSGHHRRSCACRDQGAGLQISFTESAQRPDTPRGSRSTWSRGRSVWAACPSLGLLASPCS